jgi:hypothetical protein
MGFFGETLNVPWETKILEDTPQRVSIGFYFKTYRTPLVIQKVLTIESMKPVLFINEQITNIGGEELEFAWGHHPVVGAPFLDHTCRLSMAECMVEVYHDEDGPGNRMALHQKAPWPEIKDVNGNPLDLRVIPGPESNSIDNCYLAGFKDEAFCAVTNPGKKVGFGLAWNHKVFRYFWLWQAFGGGDGWPWYHNSYQMAIEPWTSYPCTGIEDIIKRGTTVKIKPGESISSWISAVAYVGDRDVSSIKKDGTVTFSS